VPSGFAFSLLFCLRFSVPTLHVLGPPIRPEGKQQTKTLSFKDLFFLCVPRSLSFQERWRRNWQMASRVPDPSISIDFFPHIECPVPRRGILQVLFLDGLHSPLRDNPPHNLKPFNMPPAGLCCTRSVSLLNPQTSLLILSGNLDPAPHLGHVAMVDFTLFYLKTLFFIASPLKLLASNKLFLGRTNLFNVEPDPSRLPAPAVSYWRGVPPLNSYRLFPIFMTPLLRDTVLPLPVYPVFLKRSVAHDLHIFGFFLCLYA